jgi:hypothetical protein
MGKNKEEIKQVAVEGAHVSMAKELMVGVLGYKDAPTLCRASRASLSNLGGPSNRKADQSKVKSDSKRTEKKVSFCLPPPSSYF